MLPEPGLLLPALARVLSGFCCSFLGFGVFKIPFLILFYFILFS